MLIRITQEDIDRGRKMQRTQPENMYYALCNPISWAVSRMWNGEPTVDLIIDRVFVDCTMGSQRAQSSRSCIIEMPQHVRDWFRKFMVSDNVEPIQFVVIPQKVS